MIPESAALDAGVFAATVFVACGAAFCVGALSVRLRRAEIEARLALGATASGALFDVAFRGAFAAGFLLCLPIWFWAYDDRGEVPFSVAFWFCGPAFGTWLAARLLLRGDRLPEAAPPGLAASFRNVAPVKTYDAAVRPSVSESRDDADR